MNAHRRQRGTATLTTKLVWAVFFFVMFVLGRNIPLAFLGDHAASAGAINTELLNAANIATGGDSFSPSVFSLGLGPWMAAAILWRFLFIGRLARGRRIPETTVTRARNTLVVVLALVQAVSLVSNYEVRAGEAAGSTPNDETLLRAAAVLLLTAGALVVAWLAQLNERLGLGGITMFILYQLVFSAQRSLSSLPTVLADERHLVAVWITLGACVCVVLLGVFAGNAELRMHVNKVAIDSGFTGVSYLPLKLNPAGAAPIMYALTLLAVPGYFAQALAALVPSAERGAHGFLAVWGLSTPLGFAVYLVLLFALSIFFGLFTVAPREVARRMQRGGEYFDGVPPGDVTACYVRRRVIALSVASGVLLVLVTGIPLAFLGAFPELQFVLMAPQTLMILLSLLWLLTEEIADARIGTRYTFSLVQRPDTSGLTATGGLPATVGADSERRRDGRAAVAQSGGTT